MQNCDKNKSGKIDYTEFVMASMSRQNVLTKQRIQMAFKMIDTDGSGYLSYDEIRQLFVGIQTIDDKFIKDLISQVDVNGDEQISLSEFKVMLV